MNPAHRDRAAATPYGALLPTNRLARLRVGFASPHFAVRRGDSAAAEPRDASLREVYARAAMADVPRLLSLIDRNPYRPTYGCLDRNFWHYRTSDFASEMYQEGALALALVYRHQLPGNRWYGDGRVRDLAVAAIRFAARNCHADGSCDDYYPFERALGAAVFSLQATAHAYQLLDLHDPALLDWFERRASWIENNSESGRLANHHALAALGLLRVAQLTGERHWREVADRKISCLLSWQSSEGWFEEYGGADPGYLTVTIDCLAKYRQLTGADWFDEALGRAVEFARWFLHPDGSYGGEYGSRGTYHFYPHGMELLAATCPAAADLADGGLRALHAGRQAHFADDRMFIHRMAGFIEAYLDWSPMRPRGPSQATDAECRWFPQAQMLVRRAGAEQTVIAAARGGAFKHFAGGEHVASDAGLIVELDDGRLAVSQMQCTSRQIVVAGVPQAEGNGSQRAALDTCLEVAGPLHWCGAETATPAKFVALRLGMMTVGRFCRTLVRRLLQRRLITGRSEAPIRLTRRFEFLVDDDRPRLRVVDTIELGDARVRVRRMSFGTDHEMAYVAASGVYQDSVLSPWTHLHEHVERLNAERTATVVREFPA